MAACRTGRPWSPRAPPAPVGSSIRARYRHADAGAPRLADAMATFLGALKPSGSRTAR